MKRIIVPAILLQIMALVSLIRAATPILVSLHGVVTDPSGAAIPGAAVQVRGAVDEQRRTTDSLGQYSIPSLNPGKYVVRVIADGFGMTQRNLALTEPQAFDIQLAIAEQTQVLNVDEESNKLSTDPNSNAGAIILRESELQALSDDPDELRQQLQAMAGPGAGPSGGQLYVDGFTGGQMPAKSSIREVRINANPFSPEYDRLGAGRIEVFTRPGTDKIHGQAMLQYNNGIWDTRSPLLAQSGSPSYKQELFTFNVAGPVTKNRASYTFDAQRRATSENAFILATTLDGDLNPQRVNRTEPAPQTLTTLTPRLDFSLRPNHTVTARYQDTRLSFEGQGIGGFDLASRAYRESRAENTFQVTETAAINSHLISETRFQFMRNSSAAANAGAGPALIVQGAFSGGGTQAGDWAIRTRHFEISNTSSYIRRTHTIKWGGRIRHVSDDNTSRNNFGGTFTFLGGLGPQLDSANQPVPGASIALSALEVYRRTLLFGRAGLGDERVRQLGGGPYEFSIAAGAPATSVRQFDIGGFVNDDWRVRPNLTISYGLRYEDQTNLGNHTDVAPRVAVAWAPRAKASQQPKTVLRAGFGSFYERVSDAVILQARRFDGIAQQSYVVFHPDFYPGVPPANALAGARAVQQVQLIDSRMLAPRSYQAVFGADRQITSAFRIAASYTEGRGVHLERSRDINTPLNGVSPFGDNQLRLLTESTGFSRTRLISLVPTMKYKKAFLFGFYALTFSHSDAEGQPADPYNLRAEWGPSAGDVRHRAVVGAVLTLPGKISFSPFFMAASGSPYNITTGRDTNHDGFAAERPSLNGAAAAPNCTGQDSVYEPAFGCFSLNPAPGAPTISRNSGRGPSNITMALLRVARTWSLGPERAASAGPASPASVLTGVAAASSAGGSRRYGLTLGVNASNPLNHSTYAPPSGDLSSPFFGTYRSLSGGLGAASATFNRRIDVQLRFSF